jgi:hypothetical protein
VPRAQQVELVLAIARAVREEIGDLPLHVFGLGKPELVQQLFRVGVDSVDSSSYLKLAAEGKQWASNNTSTIPDPTVTERLHLALLNLANATNQALPLSFTPYAYRTISSMQAGSGAD